MDRPTAWYVVVAVFALGLAGITVGGAGYLLDKPASGYLAFLALGSTAIGILVPSPLSKVVANPSPPPADLPATTTTPKTSGSTAKR